MFQEVCESRPEVGSSRKSNSWGLATNSTPMVRRFRCSTLRPMHRLRKRFEHENALLSQRQTLRPTFTQISYYGVLVGFHLEQLEDFVNVVELFLLRNVSGLSQ